MCGFAVVAERFVSVFMTDKWLGCVPFLRIMCIVYALQPLQTSTLQSIKAVGKSSLYLWIDIVKKIIGILILLITVFFFNDVFIIVFSALVLEIISVIILFPINKIILKYGYKEQIIDIMPSMLLTLVMCVAIYMLDCISPLSGLMGLFIDVIAGMIVYVLGSIITKNENYKYIFGFIKKQREE